MLVANATSRELCAQGDGRRASRVYKEHSAVALASASAPNGRRRRKWPVGRLLACALLLTLTAGQQANAATSEQARCTRHSGEFTPGEAISPPVTLTPDLPTQTVNFGGGRGWQFAEVVLTASRPLPSSFEPSQLDIEVLRRFSRQSETLSTVTLPQPTFTEPRLNPARNIITFAVCLDGSNLGAGHYAGAIAVEGPGVGPTNLAFNLNAQNETMFLSTVIVSGVLVLFLLFWRGAATVQSDTAKGVAAEVDHADVTPEGVLEVPAKVAPTAEKAVQTRARWSLRTEVLTDPMFWAGTVLSTAAAVAAAWAIYAANTGWGASPVTDIFAIVSSIVAAAGFQSLITSAAGK